MTVRYYCDICGKEIICAAEKYTLFVKPEDIYSINLVDRHICIQCLKDLGNFLRDKQKIIKEVL